MRAQHVTWCVTMATAVCIPKITIHTHSNLIAERKRSGNLLQSNWRRWSNVCFVTADREGLGGKISTIQRLSHKSPAAVFVSPARRAKWNQDFYNIRDISHLALFCPLVFHCVLRVWLLRSLALRRLVLCIVLWDTGFVRLTDTWFETSLTGPLCISAAPASDEQQLNTSIRESQKIVRPHRDKRGPLGNCHVKFPQYWGNACEKADE